MYMMIVADSAIPFIDRAFGSFGDLVKLESKSIDGVAVHDADAIVVRSETRVDQKLLAGSKVRFVGTATIGTDHVDVDFLKRNGITFASAPGSNSNAVVQYVFAALFALARRKHFHLSGKTLGVVGVGNIGSKVVAIAKKLGMNVLQNDPPLQRLTHDPRYVPLDDLMESDFITIHVPFTRGGSDPTFHLFDERRLSLMKGWSILVNSSRGGVVDNNALRESLTTRAIGDAVLDVWENEPRIDTNLLSICSIGTPHIAGYSIDGKVNATKMILRAFCECFGLRESEDFSSMVAPPENPVVQVDPAWSDPEQAIGEVVSRCYDIEKDDESLRRITSIAPAGQAAFFKRLRSGYHFRHEFSNFRVTVSQRDALLSDSLASFGFTMN